MKIHIRPRHLPALVGFAGLMGFLLRIWAMGSGTDAEGLYRPQPLAWVLIWVLTAAVAVAVILIPRRLRSPGRYSDHFPPSIPGGIGSALAAAACLITGIGLLQTTGTFLTTISALLGLAAAGCLVLAAFCRITGKNPMFATHLIPCLYFALLAFDRCRLWSNETQIELFLFPFLALLCVMMAAYHRSCFDVALGKRRSSLFWSLMGIYLCLLSLPSGENMLFYGAMALWLLTNLCSLRPLSRPRQQVPEEPAAPAAEAPAPEADAPIVSAPVSAENMSMDQLMDWLKED